jgi:urocanate hydratase
MSDNKKLSLISGPQASAKGLANAVDIFEQLFDKDIVQKIVTETCHCTEHFKNSRGNIFSKRLRASEWQPMTAEEIYVVLALFMLMSIVQKPSLTLYFS